MSSTWSNAVSSLSPSSGSPPAPAPSPADDDDEEEEDLSPRGEKIPSRAAHLTLSMVVKPTLLSVSLLDSSWCLDREQCKRKTGAEMREEGGSGRVSLLLLPRSNMAEDIRAASGKKLALPASSCWAGRQLLGEGKRRRGLPFSLPPRSSRAWTSCSRGR